MDIITALASASHVIIVRLKPCLSFLPFRSISGTPLRLQGPLPPSIASAVPLPLCAFPARNAGVSRAGHVRLRVANNARLTIMIVAKRAGMCAGMCQAGELSRIPAFFVLYPRGQVLQGPPGANVSVVGIDRPQGRSIATRWAGQTENAEDAAPSPLTRLPSQAMTRDCCHRSRRGRQEPDRRTRRSVRWPLQGRFRVQASGEGNRDNANTKRLWSERGLPR